MKKIRKGLVGLSLAICLVGSGLNVYAMDSRVEASNVWLQSRSAGGSYKNYRATGYVTSKTNHYCNVKLYELGVNIKTGTRKWGTGKVTNTTAYSDSSALVSTYYGCEVFYGF